MGEVQALERPLRGATPGEALKRFFARYFQFHGRASRSEFWWVVAALAVISVVLSVVDFSGVSFVRGLVGLVLLIPFLSLLWRRLQDAGLSGLLILLLIVPVIGQVALLWMALLPPWDERKKPA